MKGSKSEILPGRRAGRSSFPLKTCITGSPSSAYDLYTLYGKIYFQLINAKITCKCRNKFHLPLRTVVLVFSVQSEGKLCPFKTGLWLTNFAMSLVVISPHKEKKRLVTLGDLVPQIALASQSNSANRHKFPIASTPFRDHKAISGG